ncbi:MAG TPA: replication-associated recombination protein A [Bacteroidia bacterium]|nr:replication-associated recombination protein A [Bacteroidia bacterium]
MKSPLIPLAERLRPHSLDEIVGQKHLTGPDGILRNLLANGTLPSIIFWGSPGIGKTTLAFILAGEAGLPMFSLSAINAGVKDVREVIQSAKEAGKAVLFIDEIHRFNKSQQDSLLSAVEQGIIVLIGATTENPSFEVIRPLLSRCQVYTLNPLTTEEMTSLLNRAIAEDDFLKQRNVVLKETGALFNLSNGDARKLLNLIELVTQGIQETPAVITDEVVMKIAQQRIAAYDKGGEQHYDIISAFIKSIRGSDPNAALYWLARMVEGGEDPKFIARRMLILASEDIGNANPNALLIATACFQAVEMIGYPECIINLSQAVVYLASSAKSNASYMGIRMAQKAVRDYGDHPVPMHLRNAPTALMKEMNYGEGYMYAHNYENNFADIEFLPEAIKGVKFYEPGNNAREAELRKFLKDRWKQKYNY